MESLQYYDNLDQHFDKFNQDTNQISNISEENHSSDNTPKHENNSEFMGNMYCEDHIRSIIKFFCRNDLCKQGICNQCINDHANHDFVSANDIAAFEIKSDVKKSISTCKIKLNSK